MKLLLKTMVLLTSIFVLMILLIIVFPYDDSEIEAFISSSENCAGNCLLGIRPGTTTFSETMRLLEAHAWVTDVRENTPGNGFALITWDWSGRQPRVIDTSRRGRITFYWNDNDIILLSDSVIETISIYTSIRIYSLHKWLGEAEFGAANIRPDGHLGYSVIYDIEGKLMILYTELTCPTTMMAYWNAQTRLSLSIGRSGSNFVNPSELVTVCEESQN